MRWLRRLVSTNKRRLQEGPYDLDLSYILDGRLIAMGYPSTGLRSLIRNPMNEAAAFLRARHGAHLRVYNLCIEPGWQYPPEALQPAQVIHMPMWDGQGPPLEVMHQFCTDAAAWLMLDPNNCVAVHCKAGKGRTGACIAALLIFLAMHAPHLVPELAPQADNLHETAPGTHSAAAICATGTAACRGSEIGNSSSHGVGTPGELQHAGQHVEQDQDVCRLVHAALDYYGMKRTADRKGLTICSQRRYVSYYAHLLLQMRGTWQLGAAGLQHGTQLQALLVPVRLLWVAVTGLTTCHAGMLEGCIGNSSRGVPGGNAAGQQQAHDVHTMQQWSMPHVTMTVWLRPPGQHTPQLVAYGCAGMQLSLSPQLSSSQMPAQLQVHLLQDGRLQMQLPAALHNSWMDGINRSYLQSEAAHDSTAAGGVAAGAAGLEVLGDIKVQVLPGWVQPSHPAVFKSGSLMYAWLHSAFLLAHEQHVAAARRPDHAVLFHGTQDAVADAGVHRGHGNQQGVDNTQVNVITLHASELDKVDKRLRTRHGLGLQVAYRPMSAAAPA